MTIGQRIKEARLKKGYTQEELGQRIGVKKAAINKYETGIVVNLKQSTIANLAQVLDVDPVWLIGMSDQMHREQLPANLIPISELHHHKIPVLGSVAAGQPIYDPEFPDVVVDGPLDADMALKIKGDSMIPDYQDGDLVFIKSVPDIPRSGSVCVIAVDNEAALKHVYKSNDSVTLTSNNPQYEPMTYKFTEHSVRILGVPVGFTRMFRK